MKCVPLVSLAILAVLAMPLSAAADVQLDRTVLPIHEPKYPPITELDARKATAPPRFEVNVPVDAPNVLIVLIDDLGFGQSSAFGGPIHMLTVERLADNGLRYNHFHTTALCSPTRAALLSGRITTRITRVRSWRPRPLFRETPANVP